jgi:hypothetical protein
MFFKLENQVKLLFTRMDEGISQKAQGLLFLPISTLRHCLNKRRFFKTGVLDALRPGKTGRLYIVFPSQK